jgi:hypothetical protein
MNYAEQIAACLPKGIVSEGKLLDEAFTIIQEELGSRRANHLFSYDPDFLGDMLSAYHADLHT